MPNKSPLIANLPYPAMYGSFDRGITACVSGGGKKIGPVWVPGLVGHTLCTAAMVQSYVGHHQSALCTADLHCAPWCTREIGQLVSGAQCRSMVHNMLFFDIPICHVCHQLPPQWCTMWCCQSKSSPMYRIQHNSYLHFETLPIYTMIYYFTQEHPMREP